MRNLLGLFIIKARLHRDKSNNKGPASPGLLGAPLALIIQSIMYRDGREEEDTKMTSLLIINYQEWIISSRKWSHHCEKQEWNKAYEKLCLLLGYQPDLQLYHSSFTSLRFPCSTVRRKRGMKATHRTGSPEAHFSLFLPIVRYTWPYFSWSWSIWRVYYGPSAMQPVWHGWRQLIQSRVRRSKPDIWVPGPFQVEGFEFISWCPWVSTFSSWKQYQEAFTLVLPSFPMDLEQLKRKHLKRFHNLFNFNG